MTINLLDEKTINQIAAGEVVESPASVLKELVENAIDAGATILEIDTLAGGLEMLRISDNGCGMSLEDLEKCILRHATSKLRSIEDLSRLQTMGFRGEALAAIAAVSRLKIQTHSARHPQDSAWQMEVEGGVVTSFEPSSRSSGTTVEVRDLFYNVPARKVFQKGPSASASEITRVIGALALTYPHVQWIYKSGGKLLAQWPVHSSQGEFFLERCRLVLGEDFAKGASYVSATRQGWKLWGWLAHANLHKPSRGSQYWIVNHRLVQLPQMSYWVQEGYGTRLPVGRFPSFVLHLELPGDWIDVNVHPQKKEVRLKDPGWLGSWIAHQVNLALSGLESQSFESPGFAPALESLVIDSNKLPPLDPFEIKDPSGPQNQSVVSSLDSSFQLPELSSFNDVPAKFVKPSSSFSPAFDFELRPLAVWKRFSLWPVEELKKRLPLWDKEILAATTPWVLAWMSSSRAMARLRFEQATSYKEQVLSHALLIPLRLQWRVDEMDRLFRHEKRLKELGLDMVALDRQSLALHTLPVGLEESEAKDFLDAFLELEQKSPKLEKENAAHLLARFIENTNIISAGAYEMAPSDLILGLSNCHQPFYSPSGKPIFKPLALGDLEARARRGE